LKLKYGEPHSNFAFNSNLRRYMLERALELQEAALGPDHADVTVGFRV